MRGIQEFGEIQRACGEHPNTVCNNTISLKCLKYSKIKLIINLIIKYIFKYLNFCLEGFFNIFFSLIIRVRFLCLEDCILYVQLFTGKHRTGHIVGFSTYFSRTSRGSIQRSSTRYHRYAAEHICTHLFTEEISLREETCGSAHSRIA